VSGFDFVIDTRDNTKRAPSGDTNTHYFDEEEVTLEQAQKLVGGYVQMIDRGGIQFLFNEDGLMRGLPVNTEASQLLETQIVGDVVVLEGESRWV
jgi:hypothetical protein|tara:strand:+ start:2844 stop:3128 length:285 start_codon:yes stop_codon:yes gene_type:complete